MPRQSLIQFRGGTASQWTSANPVLALGEPGYETDTGLVKYGDGSSAWVDLLYAPAGAVETQVQNATGSTIAKGSVVYISGANGNNPLISLADADTEATSSKTIGITTESIANGAQGKVIESGILTGINTSSATIGQSVWLSSTAGGLVYGAPPAKPAHSVYLGVVIRVHANNGAILVKVQNGYEVNELHDVNAGSPADNDVLAWDSASSMWTNQTAAQAGLAAASHTHTIANVTGLQTALDDKAALASPALSGTPTAPTAAAGTNTTQIATTAFVGTAVSNLVASAPAALDTLNELAAALGNDANFATTVTNSIATKANIASPALTGTPTAPTAAADTNTTQIATTAYVVGQGYLKSATAASTYAPVSHTHTAAQVTPGTSVKSANYTLQSSDAQTIMLLQTGGGAITITVPDILQNGQRIDFVQSGANQTTFTGSGVTINSVDSKVKLSKNNSGGTIMKVNGVYFLIGDLA